MSGQRRPAVLDRPAARVVALGVALAAAAALAWYHRADLLPPDSAAAPASPREAAFRACFEPRAAQLAGSLESGELTPEQFTQFRGTAEAICADRAKRAR